MALAYKATIRQAMLDAITTAAGNAALLRIYDGSRPSDQRHGNDAARRIDVRHAVCAARAGTTDGAAVTLTLGTITQDASANATGTATWFRIVKADGTTFVMDGSVGTSGSDLNLTTTSIVATQPVSVTSFVITEGNQ
jgi:hypothetical protein